LDNTQITDDRELAGFFLGWLFEGVGVTAPLETRYARSGEISIAYRVLGEGPIDLVLVPGIVSHVEFLLKGVPGEWRLLAVAA
jgi:hypothetical protein